MEFSLHPVLAPNTEPLTRADATRWANIEDTADNDLVDGLIRSARERIEAVTGRAFVSQQWDLLLDGFPSASPRRPDGDILLPRAPVHQVTSITYVDGDGATQTLAAADYTVDRRREPCRIVPAYGESWPSTRDVPNAVTARFRAGYSIPVTADQAIDLLTAVGHPYANTDPVQLVNLGGVLPAGLSVRTTYYVRDVSGDTFKLAATSGGTAIDITGAGTGTHLVGLMPEPLLQALKVLVATMYWHREEASDEPLELVPYTVRRLVVGYRLFPGLVSRA